MSNPEKAGLEDWAWVEVVTDNVEKVMHGRDGRATMHGQDAHATTVRTRQREWRRGRRDFRFSIYD